MHVFDYVIVSVIVLAAVMYSVWKLQKALKEKGGGCNGCCEGCERRGQCGKKTDNG